MGIKMNFGGKEVSGKVSISARNAVEKILRNAQASIMEEFTKFPKPPIKSGQLRQSIDIAMTGFTSGKVFAKKNYAQFVEYGTVRMAPRPFMRRGINRVAEENLEIMRDELKKF